MAILDDGNCRKSVRGLHQVEAHNTELQLPLKGLFKQTANQEDQFNSAVALSRPTLNAPLKYETGLAENVNHEANDFVGHILDSNGSKFCDMSFQAVSLSRELCMSDLKVMRFFCVQYAHRTTPLVVQVQQMSSWQKQRSLGWTH